MPSTIIHSRAQHGIARSRFKAMSAALLLLAAGGFAQAHEFCASTTTGFQNALNDASDDGMYNGELNSINLV